jgi:hypothetical protein
MPELKNGQHHAASAPPASSSRVQLTERELRWTDEFACEGVAIVRSTAAPVETDTAAHDG